MRLLMVIGGLLAAAPAVAQTELLVQLDGAPVRLPVPAGYCSLDTRKPEEARIYDRQAQAILPDKRLLGFAVVCDELEAFRTGQQHFGHYLMLVVVLDDRGAPARWADSQRPSYLARLASEFNETDIKALAEKADCRATITIAA